MTPLIIRVTRPPRSKLTIGLVPTDGIDLEKKHQRKLFHDSYSKFTTNQNVSGDFYLHSWLSFNAEQITILIKIFLIFHDTIFSVREISCRIYMHRYISAYSLGIYLKLHSYSEIWKSPRKYCCRNACHLSEQFDNSLTQSRGIDTSRDLAIRHLSA